MKLTVTTPGGVLYSADADQVTLPGTVGEFTVLPHHARLVAELGAGMITFKGYGRNPVEITGGYAEINNGIVQAFVELKDRNGEKKSQ